jgi:hypothetical protein
MGSGVCVYVDVIYEVETNTCATVEETVVVCCGSVYELVTVTYEVVAETNTFVVICWPKAGKVIYTVWGGAVAVLVTETVLLIWLVMVVDWVE